MDSYLPLEKTVKLEMCDQRQRKKNKRVYHTSWYLAFIQSDMAESIPPAWPHYDFG